MPLIALPSAASRVKLARTGVAGVIGVGVAAVLSVATFSDPDLARRVGHEISEAAHGVETVAAMLADRSPGERPEGALANLKPKRHAAVEERALPKVRGPGPTTYQALAGSPPTPPIAPPPQVPLYTAVTGAPTPVTPVALAIGGGPPVLSNIPLPGGGGGIFTPPTVQATPEVPTIPVTPTAPVPEPASWVMMILGFALMAGALRRGSGARPNSSLE